MERKSLSNFKDNKLRKIFQLVKVETLALQILQISFGKYTTIVLYLLGKQQNKPKSQSSKHEKQSQLIYERKHAKSNRTEIKDS